MKYYSYTFSATKVSELINHFEQYQLDPDGEYVYFYARIGDTQVRVYLPKKVIRHKKSSLVVLIRSELF